MPFFQPFVTHGPNSDTRGRLANHLWLYSSSFPPPLSFPLTRCLHSLIRNHHQSSNHPESSIMLNTHGNSVEIRNNVLVVEKFSVWWVLHSCSCWRTGHLVDIWPCDFWHKKVRFDRPKWWPNKSICVWFDCLWPSPPSGMLDLLQVYRLGHGCIISLVYFVLYGMLMYFIS